MNRDAIGYTIGPIDMVAPGDQICKNWRGRVVEAAVARGMADVVFFDPSGPFKIPTGHPGGGMMSRYIEDVNWLAMVGAHFNLGLLTKHVASMGSPIEIDIAAQFRIPTILITDIPFGKSVYLDNRVPAERRVPIREDFQTSIDDAISLVYDLLAGPQGPALFAEQEMRLNNLRSQLRGTAIDYSTHHQDTIEAPRPQVLPMTANLRTA